jgi:hypothetical protein
MYKFYPLVELAASSPAPLDIENIFLAPFSAPKTPKSFDSERQVRQFVHHEIFHSFSFTSLVILANNKKCNCSSSCEYFTLYRAASFSGGREVIASYFEARLARRLSSKKAVNSSAEVSVEKNVY